MITVRQIEKHWQARTYNKLIQELLTARPEAAAYGAADLSGSVVAAAISLIRLDELSQASAPICPTLIRALIASQDRDGGWRDPATSALVLRALLTARGSGVVIERGLAYLAALQKEEGAWPKEPIRRLAADALTTAFVLFQLGAEPCFRDRVRCEAAAHWLEEREQELDAITLRLWHRARVRCRMMPAVPAASDLQPMLAWS